ncbi:hypothetical protein AVEN_75056-1 [Araneus ventricosus]|uniref:Uncharacterized protein n=1 Tax=Araneus ventricosus TaxID=182803 RepID=A0A4Y2NWR5_ARAVE|nr:hypothetical protein AVEN_75056-1 [Araneus ventricosus]
MLTHGTCSQAYDKKQHTDEAFSEQLTPITSNIREKEVPQDPVVSKAVEMDSHSDNISRKVVANMRNKFSGIAKICGENFPHLSIICPSK